MANKYLITGLTLAGGSSATAAGVYAIKSSNKQDSKKEEAKKPTSFVEYLKGKNKIVLSISDNTHNSEWTTKQSAYGQAEEKDLITKVENSKENNIPKSPTISIEDLKNWCGRKASSPFSNENDSEYKKFFKWCVKENE
ncbi:hypothetical protein HF1_08530 [Mycoplasma haemofelis str. Langford 1]|uniref:Lipoprotein n=2 Tax=Mycoplasma haemofelis TaxID=29501 RepID=F6FIZ2_MYCHI|nr:hypothetical protein [Mycoplasma haemofelis]AEG73190.1 hypothetical protein MHF_0933 [Mycoplasma haemofelis Ohio2]CBY92861.1 hypothetical protein HF1_08530 [Mycoplasma haemofelis str. Langford 1]